MSAESIENRRSAPILGSEHCTTLLEAAALELGSQQVRLRTVARFVANPGHALRLLPERFQLVEEIELVPDEQQVDISAPNFGLDGEPRPFEVHFRLARFERADIALEAALPVPGERLRRHEQPVARLHFTDLDFAEAVVLDAQGQHRIREGLGLGHELEVRLGRRARARQFGRVARASLTNAVSSGSLARGRAGRHDSRFHRRRRPHEKQEQRESHGQYVHADCPAETWSRRRRFAMIPAPSLAHCVSTSPVGTGFAGVHFRPETSPTVRPLR
jgi:hypothetical protein